MKKISVALFLLGSVACGSETKTPAANTVVDVAASKPEFSTLVAAVKKAGLAETLSGAGPFTVFAPTNSAFEALKNAGIDATQLDAATLAAVLKYHVVSAKAVAADVAQAESETTLNGDVKVGARGGKLYLNGLTEITATDVQASNGVIHVIDSVLLPDTTLLDVVGIATAYPVLSSLAGAVVKASLVSALQGTGPFTVFAPTNDAFAQLTSAPSDAALPGILQYHVLSGSVQASAAITVAQSASPGNEVATLQGSKVTLSLAGQTLKVNASNVTYANIGAKNGVIHLVDGVLIPN